jgi:hypothetical protein
MYNMYELINMYTAGIIEPGIHLVTTAPCCAGDDGSDKA